MEKKITYLGEPRSTRLDAFLSGEHQVAIECKFTEFDVGPCSHPRQKKGSSEFCDGSFMRQAGRNERCSLTETGILYWKYVSLLFRWENTVDMNPCPLYRNYQLVRNVLAACVRPDGNVSPANSRVVLLYDDRNPAFQEDGEGLARVCL